MSDFQNVQNSLNQTSSFNTYWTYSFINNSLFYPLVPHQYYDYYNRFVRHYFYWYDGYVPYYHTQYGGILSSRLAYTLCSGLADLVNGGNLMFDTTEELSDFRLEYNKRDKEPSDALEFIEKWSYDVDLTNKNGMAIEYAMAGGDSVMKLNSDGETLYPQVLRKDSYFLDVDFRGKVTAFTGMNYSYVRTNQVGDTDAQQTEDYFYILEERKYNEKNKPIYRIFVKAGYGNLTTNKTIDFRKQQELKWEELPKDVQKMIKREYPNTIIGEWYDLPLPSIGVYMFKNSENISFMPQVRFGESILSNLLSYLQLWDYYVSAKATDLQLGRGRVIVPKGMQNPNAKDVATNHYQSLNSEMYTYQDYIDPTQQKPIPIQFELRGSDWETVRTNILQDISFNLKISQRTIANFLEDGAEKATAREISVDDKTATFVENKRTLFKKPINDLLQDVLEFYEFPDEIRVRFSRVGLNNMNDVVTQATTLKNSNLIDTKTALTMIFVDKNDRQLEEMKNAIEEEIKQKQEMKVKQETNLEKINKEMNNNDINQVEKPKE